MLRSLMSLFRRRSTLVAREEIANATLVEVSSWSGHLEWLRSISVPVTRDVEHRHRVLSLMQSHDPSTPEALAAGLESEDPLIGAYVLVGLGAAAARRVLGVLSLTKAGEIALHIGHLESVPGWLASASDRSAPHSS